MKIHIILIFIFCFVFQSQAQQLDENLPFRQRIEKFKRIKNMGLGLTALGGVAVIVGLTLTASDKNDDQSYNPGYTEPDEGLTRGEIITVAGVFLLGPGIPLWIIGGNGESKYKEKLKAISVRPNMNFQQGSITLTYRF